jgi:hypothetical protein
MAKSTNFQDKLNSIGSKLKETKSSTPIQEIKGDKVVPVVSETKFTVHIPTETMDHIRSLAFRDKKKLKTVFIEALHLYLAQNK